MIYKVLMFDKLMATKERSLRLSEVVQVYNIRNVNQAAVCHAKLLHDHVVELPPIRVKDVFNDITKGWVGSFVCLKPRTIRAM